MNTPRAWMRLTPLESDLLAGRMTSPLMPPPVGAPAAASEWDECRLRQAIRHCRQQARRAEGEGP